MTFDTGVRRSTSGWPLLVGMAAALATLWAAHAAVAAAPALTEPPTFRPYIVNGMLTSAYPTSGALLIYNNASHSSLDSFCSGTLIGCQTFLTAAHCVCPGSADTAAACQRRGVSPPATLQVFLQHAGVFAVSRVDVNPVYVFGEGGDLALITLAEPVTGIAPSPINTVRQPAAGTAGTVVGFGNTAGGHNAVDDAGIKRAGAIATAACSGGMSSTFNVCWNFAGTGADTCEGDSGGPLFIDFGSGALLAGVTSGGASASCRAPDAAFDTAVFANTAWIAGQSGGNVSALPCGPLPPVGDVLTTTLDTAGQLSAAQPLAHWDLTVAAGTSTLRIALNGVPWSGAGGQTMNNFDLYVRAGDPPNTAQYDCADVNPTTFGFCEITAPAPGTWSVLANRVSGSGLFQLTATTFAPAVPNTCAGDCNNDGVVTVDELLTSVGIALDITDISACPASDRNGDGTVSVDELLTAVNSALDHC